MKISVIIPAHNAADTIGATVASIKAQTFSEWEAIVIDDGSSDRTRELVAKFAEQDPRICTIEQPQGGQAAALNTGINLAHFEWLLFLDADDWILPQYLERLDNTLASEPCLDAIHCGWVRVAPDGGLSPAKFGPKSAETFAASARYCPWAIHACMVRRSLVRAVGGFDTILHTCQDWDFWQRIARSGACFGAIPEVLVHYRMRPESSGVNGPQILIDGLQVIDRGHAPDPRVPDPNPAYAAGLPAGQLPGARLLWACWAAGLVIGRGEDARLLLESVREDHELALDGEEVACRIFEAALIPTCRTPDAWPELWPHLERRIEEFLLALEIQSLSPRLACRSRTVLERLILQYSSALRPLTFG